MNYKDAPLETEDFVSQMVVLYRELRAKAKMPPAPTQIQWTVDIPLANWLDLQAWYEATKDMTEQEYIAYYESVYGVGSWAETKALGLCDMLGVCICDEEENN